MKDDNTREIKIKGRFHTQVAGITFLNDDGSNRLNILSTCSPGEKLILTHTPIPQDKNAVKLSRLNGEQIGWLSAWNAKEIAPILKRGETVDAEIVNVIRREDSVAGCTILITKPEAREILQKYRISSIHSPRWRWTPVKVILLVTFIGAMILLATCIAWILSPS